MTDWRVKLFYCQPLEVEMGKRSKAAWAFRQHIKLKVATHQLLSRTWNSKSWSRFWTSKTWFHHLCWSHADLRLTLSGLEPVTTSATRAMQNKVFISWHWPWEFLAALDIVTVVTFQLTTLSTSSFANYMIQLQVDGLHVCSLQQRPWFTANYKTKALPGHQKQWCTDLAH